MTNKTPQQMYEHFTVIMEQMYVQLAETGTCHYEDDFYKVDYNARTAEVEATYKGPPLSGADR